ELAREDLQCAARARLAAGDHAEKRRPASEHRLRAERAGLQDIDASAHATVEQHGHLRADGARHGGQRIEARRGAIELAAAVVGHDYAVAPERPALSPPVGAIATGSFDSTPKIGVRMSTCATSTSTFGSSRTRSKATRFSRSVTSSSAPPSKKSKIARGRRRRASWRRSSILIALERSAI